MKRRPKAAALVLALCALAGVCRAREDRLRRDAIAFVVDARMQGRPFSLQPLAGPASQICVIGPFTSPERARSLLGYDWQDRYGIERRNDVSIVVFLGESGGAGDKKLGALGEVAFPAQVADFSPLADSCFAPSSPLRVERVHERAMVETAELEEIPAP
jgi:hypothetical protein